MVWNIEGNKFQLTGRVPAPTQNTRDKESVVKDNLLFHIKGSKHAVTK
jgi:hypothetical protein